MRHFSTLTKLAVCLAFLVFPVAVNAQSDSVGLATASTQEQVQELLAFLEQGESFDERTLTLQDISFELDEARLDVQSKSYLDVVVRLMNQVENVNLNITGHTDNQGEAAYNLDLSSRRARAVRSYLESHGVDVSRLEARGVGESQPIADNAEESGRALNRRVELTFVKKADVARVQDVLVLRSGERLGVIIIAVGADVITYRSITDGQRHEISKDEVEKVIYASGEEIAFEPSDQVASASVSTSMRGAPQDETPTYPDRIRFLGSVRGSTGLVLGFPNGNLGDVVGEDVNEDVAGTPGTGFGITVLLNYSWTERLDGMLQAGFMYFGGNRYDFGFFDVQYSYEAVPLLVGARYYLLDRENMVVHAGAMTGIHLFRVSAEYVGFQNGTSDESETQYKLTVAPEVGLQVGKIDASVGYMWYIDGGYASLRVGYTVPLTHLFSR